MFKSSREFETVMYEILVKIRDGESYQTLSSKYAIEDLNEAMEECSNLGFVTGVIAHRTAANTVYIDLHNPKITYRGLKFVEAFKS